VAVDITQFCLLKYIQPKNAFYSKVLELRKNVAEWLAYIPQSFPTYTRHTLKHSDEIVLQLSKLLFFDSDFEKPSVRLSFAEAYILIVSAYLHDAGMVVSDKEKVEILASNEWQHYVSDGNPGAKRLKAIQEFRSGSTPSDEVQRNFLADVQTRFLIAEFIRRVHHQRVSNIITQHEAALGNFSFGDPVLRRTINDVCIAHGLDHHELLDIERFPERRDIQGETVNVRFLAILLRIGDLLDLSFDRACSLLLNAACPLPADSLAQWTKYQRIKHRLTAPDKIELHAYCHNQNEHRYLEDWCRWLVDEIREAGNTMARASRHSNWRSPEVSLNGDTPTIRIRPDENATYIPSKWKFELDPNEVFQRLIKDVYDHPLSFMRELIQNALDATRCQIYLDLTRKGFKTPDFPTRIEEEHRNQYSIKVSLSTKIVKNELSNEDEEYQVLSVEDFGIGMDKYIIENYFLQVGRSFYTTEEFRRDFRFIPTSQFGLGFLSVFAVSDHVRIETFKPSSQRDGKPLSLVLTGPRNYLLIETGTRRTPGTLIEVLLRKPLNQGEVTEAVSKWCKRVEFPIIVHDMGKETIIKAERPEDFEYEIPVLTRENARFRLKAYPIKEYGVEGEIYLFSLIDRKGERFDQADWAQRTYPEIHAAAERPRLPENIVCNNGIVVGFPGFNSNSFCFRVDIRKKTELPISRHMYDVDKGLLPEIRLHLENILRKHLDKSKLAREEGWKYKNRIISEFPIYSFWASVPETICVLKKGEQYLASFAEIVAEEVITLLVAPENVGNAYHITEFEDDANLPFHKTEIGIRYEDFEKIDRHFRAEIFQNREICCLRKLRGGQLIIGWKKTRNGDNIIEADGKNFLLYEFEKDTALGISIDGLPGIFNSNNPLIKWLFLVRDACKQGKYGLTENNYRRALREITNILRYPHLYSGEQSTLPQYLRSWRTIPGIPKSLLPPFENITLKMIMFIWSC
jgi:molecular chaperone HtpG